MKSVQIISLSAPRPRSGKDTLADMLVEHYGSGRVVTIAFGDYLRECVSHLFGHVHATDLRHRLDTFEKDVRAHCWAGHNLVHADFREWMIQNGHSLMEKRSPRWYMQHFGNDYVKGHMGLENFWVDVVDRRIEQLYRNNQKLELIIVTDTRSPNEFEWLQSTGAKTINVVRTGFPKDVHDDPTRVPHPVELHALSWNYDHTLYNQFGFKAELLDDALCIIDL